MKLDSKGLLSPFSLITSIITGMGFPLIGSLIILDIGNNYSIYPFGLLLTIIGGFIAHWLLAHSTHDYFKKLDNKRRTISKKSLKIVFVFSIISLLIIAIYLSIQRGWPVIVFSLIGLICCFYVEGVLHHESQMAFGAMFLVIGSFYIQVGTLNLDYLIWLKVIMMSLFAFFSQYGWLLFYRLDDYNWNKKIKNKSILITKTGIIFLIFYLLL
jgi:hypothetical protein